MNTKPLYLENAYLKTCTAKIVGLVINKDHCVLILDQTIFYPEGGGQPCDQGTIKTKSGKLKVEKVSLKGDKIVHEGKIEGDITTEETVNCQIDWTRRYKNMQVHSAGHVLHEAAKILIPDLIPIEGQHGKHPFIKYQGMVSKTLERPILEQANQIIAQDLEIQTEFVSLDELKKRSPWTPPHLPVNKPLRIMWIGQYLPIPDGGTQAKRTGEIPLFSQINIEAENNITIIRYSIKHQRESVITSSATYTNFDNNKLQNLKNEALAQIIQSTDPEELDRLRIHYLGKSGQLTQLAKELAKLSPEEKSESGKIFNDAKLAITEALSSKPNPRHQTLDIDFSLPGIRPPTGHLHPVTHAIEEISSIFEKIGFVRVRYPEVEWDWYAFEALNMPKTHPARDDWETFFVSTPENKKMGKTILTPHTSSGQVREMERLKTPPIRMVNIAKCYRRQSDVSHTVMFHHFEGLVVDKGINISHLKGAIDHFVKQFFGLNRKFRIRPYHFQFTEPSFEVDVTCDICLGKARLPDGQGCKLCKEGWLELGGAGMVHPNVLKAGKIDPDKYTGFAFGWGVERTYMMKAGVKIDDLRLLYSNDIRFLNQF